MTEKEQKIKKKSRRLKINISGEIYETRRSTLRRFPNTLLGNEKKRSKFYNSALDQYFFHEQKRIFFDAILYFYQSNGHLILPVGCAFEDFEEECRFFELPEEYIRGIKSKEMLEMEEMENENENNQGSKSKSLRDRMWDLLQNPETSILAKACSIFSLTMILLSVLMTCLESVPELRADSKEWAKNPWSIIELVLNSWFLFELVMGALCAPNIRKYLSSSMTWVDIAAVVPYFVVLTVSKGENLQSLGFLRIVRLARITRLFRLSKHSTKLKLVGKILLSCVGDFKTLLLCVIIIVFLAGSIMYFLEDKGENDSGFQHIPICMYWAVQTITTLGYGDMFPYTAQGRIFAGVFMLFGAVSISVPLLSIVAKFEEQYDLSRGKSLT